MHCGQSNLETNQRLFDFLTGCICGFSTCLWLQHGAPSPHLATHPRLVSFCCNLGDLVWCTEEPGTYFFKHIYAELQAAHSFESVSKLRPPWTTRRVAHAPFIVATKGEVATFAMLQTLLSRPHGGSQNNMNSMNHQWSPIESWEHGLAARPG